MEIENHPALLSLTTLCLAASIPIMIARTLLSEQQWSAGPLPLVPFVPAIIPALIIEGLGTYYGENSQEKIVSYVWGTATEAAIATLLCLLLNPLGNESLQNYLIPILTTISLTGITKATVDTYRLNHQSN